MDSWDFLYLHFTFVVYSDFSNHLERDCWVNQWLSTFDTKPLSWEESTSSGMTWWGHLGDSENRNLPKSRFIEPGRNLLINVGTVIDYFLRVAERLLAQTDGTTVVGHARGFRVAGDATQMVSHDSRRNLGRWVKSGCHRGEARFVLVHTQSVSLISLVYDLAAQMPLGPVLTALTRGHWSAVAVYSQPDGVRFPCIARKYTPIGTAMYTIK